MVAEWARNWWMRWYTSTVTALYGMNSLELEVKTVGNLLLLSKLKSSNVPVLRALICQSDSDVMSESLIRF